MIQGVILVLAYTVDWLIGDPRWLPHPVVWIGKAIERVESVLRRWVTSQSGLRIAGILLAIFIVGGSYGVVWLLVKGASLIHPWLALALQVWVISTTIATKGLAEAGLEIYDLLKKGQIAEARKALSMVVGRDTDRLDEGEISRGAVETVAENIVDAIVSPLFYAAIGGAPLAMAYRAVNTLDSMVGYKNDRYLHFGWASARFDDVANYVPARLAGLILIAVCWMVGLDWRGSYDVIRRDAKLHPSPNSGITESGVAGALGIELGGTNFYQGIASVRARMGSASRPIVAADIMNTVEIMKKVSLGSLLLGVFIAIGIWG